MSCKQLFNKGLNYGYIAITQLNNIVVEQSVKLSIRRNISRVCC